MGYVQLDRYTVKADSITNIGTTYVNDGEIISENFVNQGYLNMNNGSLETDNIINKYIINAESGQLICNGNMIIDSGYEDKNNVYSCSLNMDNEQGYVLVKGDLHIGTKTGTGTLSAGTLEVKGDFICDKPESFCATGTHKTILSGNNNEGKLRQKITVNNYRNSQLFNVLVITKALEKGYESDIDINRLCSVIVRDYDDKENPSDVENLAATEITMDTISLKFDEAADNMEVCGYYLYRDGELIADINNTTYKDIDLMPGTDYTYEVCAYDYCDNKSTNRTLLTVTTEGDNEPPTIPYRFSIYKRTGRSVSMSWYASTDNLGVDRYEIYRNGKKIDELKAGKNDNYINYRDSDLKQDTVYEYYVVAVDRAGNRSDKTSVIKTYVSNPAIERISPGDNSAIGNDKVNITIYANNNINNSNYTAALEYRHNGSEWQTIADKLHFSRESYGRLYASYNWDISNINDGGEYEIKITVYDEDGNSSTKSVTYIIDKSAPEKPQNLTVKSEDGVNILHFTPSVSADCEGYVVYRKTEDNNVFKQYAKIPGKFETGYSDKNVEEGKIYEYAISAYDKYNNESSITEAVTIQTTRDNIPPVIKGITPDDKEIAGVKEISVTAADNVKVKQITLYYNREDDNKTTKIGTSECVDGVAAFNFDTTKLEDGVYILSAVAMDIAGNESTELYTRRYTTDNTGIEKIELDKHTIKATSVQLRWKDVKADDLAYFAVEKLVNPDTDEFVRIGTVKDVLGYNVNNLIPEETYTFRVVGYDRLGNRGIPSDEITVTTISDEISPSINSILPIQSRYRDTIELSMSVSDNDGVKNGVFAYSVDGINYVKLASIETKEKLCNETIEYVWNTADIPEGEVYVRFQAYDLSGNKNALLEGGNEVIVKYIIDRTAPDRPENTKAYGEKGYVNILWDGQEGDTVCYVVSRADGEDGAFYNISDKCTNTDYYDNNVIPGHTYRYRVAATDIAGNTGEYGEIVSATVDEDTEAPVIKGISPKTDSVIGLNGNINIVAIDNSAIQEVVVECKKEADDAGLFNKIYTKTYLEENERSVYVQFSPKEVGLTEGKYDFRVSATDKFGNYSEYTEVSYTIDTTPPDTPVIECTPGGYKIEVAITGEQSEDFKEYKIYKADVSGGGYSCIATTSARKYIDKTAVPGRIYCYKVLAYDIYGNYSESEVVTSYATDEDTEAPAAIITENICTLTGFEISLDGGASTDNVRITDYTWSMGNGDVLKGVMPVYTYNKEGVYTVKLTVKDAAGNTSSAETTVKVLNNENSGTATVNVTDKNGIPLPYADIYLKSPDGSIDTMRADAKGEIKIAGAEGVYEIAAYYDKYLPADTTVVIDRYEKKIINLQLEEGNIVVGNLDVKRMTLQEIIDAGVDVSDPDNINSFAFTITVKLAKSPIPRQIQYIGGGISETPGNALDFHGEWKEPESTSSGTHTPAKEPVPEAKLLEKDQPIIAIVSTSNKVSWLKDMYSVDLNILNAAETKYVIKESKAELKLPDGVSLAVTKDKQSLKYDMGNIMGQQQKTATWVVKGDKSGSYKLEADFTGKLSPFNRNIYAHFETEKEFEVTKGEGIVVSIYPEKDAYIDENYYIQFEIKNTSGKDLYNFHTSMPPYHYETSRSDTLVIDKDKNETVHRGSSNIISAPSGYTSATVLKGGDTFRIPVLYSGQAVNGTYFTKFGGSGDKDKEYYTLIESLVEAFGDIEGVTIEVHPIDSHISKTIVEQVEVKNYFGDPVDLSTGAFTDSMTPMSVNAASELAFNLEYNSGLSTLKGENGYGFYNNLETSIEDKNNVISLNLTSGITGAFINKEMADGTYYGKVVDDEIFLEENSNVGEYIPISELTKEYKLFKEADGTYKVITPTKEIYLYDESGRNTQITDSNGRNRYITYGNTQKIITEEASGKRIIINYNSEGLITSVADDNGRKSTFTYQDGKLMTYTNVMGETTTFTYDAENRIISETDCENVTYVKNIYDEKGRVIEQSDADESKKSLKMTYENDGENTIVKAYDSLGNVGEVVLDSNGRTIKNVNTNGNVTEMGYDENGNQIFEKDALDGTVINEYDSHNRKISVRDQSGNKLKFTYDDNGNVTSTTDANGNTATYEYNDRNLLIKTTDYAGCVTTYEYNDYAQVLRKTIEGIGSTTYEYAEGMLVKTTDYNGNAKTYTYDGTGCVVSETDALGGTTVYTHDALLRTLTKTNAIGGTKSYTYDKYGNVLTETNEAGQTTTYEYDIIGNKTADITPDGRKIRYEYDSNGRNTKIIKPDGTELSYTYDAEGNMLSETDESGNVITYEYDALNQKISETNAAGDKIKYAYYPNGKLYAEIYPDNSRTLYTYDSTWKLIRKTDSQNNSETYRYDEMGRIIETRDALGNSEKCEYGINGRLLSTTDKNGNTTSYKYDANGNCIEKTLPDGTIMTNTYDALSRLISVSTETKANGKITISYEYDALSRLTKTINEAGNAKTYSYDRLGNLISETDEEGHTTRYEYDINNNLIKTIDAAGHENTYEYNNTNNLIKENKYTNTEDSVTTSYNYDKTGRLTEVTDPLDGITKTSYDNIGNVTTVTDANGGTTTYTYDKMCRPVSETNAIGVTKTNEYNATGLLTESTNGRNQKTKYTYDAIGRITSKEDETGRITYEYDKNGNVLKETEEKKQNTTGNMQVVSDKNVKVIKRTFDSRNRVTSYTDANGKTIRYGYDELGNILTIAYPGGETIRYTYYASGQIATVTDSKGRVTYYKYDKTGNLTDTERPNGTKEHCEYNELGLLTSKKDIKTATGEVINEYHYKYDVRGNIVGVVDVTADTSAKTTDATLDESTVDIKNESETTNGLTEDNNYTLPVPDTANKTALKLAAESNSIVTSDGETVTTSLEMEYDSANRLISYNNKKIKYDKDGNMLYGPVCGLVVSSFASLVSLSFSVLVSLSDFLLAIA